METVSRDLKNRLNGFFHMMNLAVERKEKDEIIADFANWLNSNYILTTNNDESALEEIDSLVEKYELKDLINMVVAKEYKRAVEKHEDKYNSYHEAMAKLRGKLEDVKIEYSCLTDIYIDFWDWVKKDEDKAIADGVPLYKEVADRAIVAMVQVRVALQKIGNMKKDFSEQDEKNNR